MSTWRIPLADIDLDQREKQAVLDVLERRWLTMGEVTQAFESEFSQFICVKHALAVANCTVALHMACLALDIGPGDEVIVPSLTFVATANAVRYTGAKPVFADVNSSQDLTISPQEIEKLITPQTKAIIVMHYGGYPCRMHEIMEIARRHNLAVIEDDAHAPGATLDGVKMGVWGDIGCFSFFSNKNMTTGEGGMVTTQRDDLAEKFRLLRSHGMTTLTWDRHRGHAWSYDVVAPGYNYRMDEIRAAIGRVQLQKLPENNARREIRVQQYQELFQEALPQVEVPFQSFNGQSAYHLMPVLLPRGSDRVKFMESMKSSGVQTSVHYPPAHLFSHYRALEPNANGSLPLTEDIAAREVTLPLYAGLKAEDVEIVVEATAKALVEACP
jgi:dTDP-4-amino-4,6-dideoxygalactose transaminase